MDTRFENYISRLINEYFNAEYLWHKFLEEGDEENGQMQRAARAAYKDALDKIDACFPDVFIRYHKNGMYTSVILNGVEKTNPFVD